VEIPDILIVGSILLACGSCGLLVVRLSNPSLKGLGWLGGSFGAGGIGALLLLLRGNVPTFFSVLCADVLILLAFVLLHISFLDLVDSESNLRSPGLLLLGIQALADVPYLYPHPVVHLRIVTVGVLVAVQVLLTVRLLVRSNKKGVRAPVWFCVIILSGFAAVNLLRSIADAVGLLSAASIFYQVEALTFLIYIATALGIAFGFFWMTTATLSSALEEIASTDPLTRIYNRRVFREWCEKELIRSEQTGITFSLLMVDLDHFKQINDRFGHRAGDDALCAVVEQMQRSIRGIDVLGRWGGEEFVVLLPGASASSALQIAQRLRGNVETLMIPPSISAFSRGEEAIPVTASLGVASYRGVGDQIEDMLERADAALYEAKDAGRNRVLAAI
jgi:diguanylate cyclase (GGDEF)-like protein